MSRGAEPETGTGATTTSTGGTRTGGEKATASDEPGDDAGEVKLGASSSVTVAAGHKVEVKDKEIRPSQDSVTAGGGASEADADEEIQSPKGGPPWADADDVERLRSKSS